MLASRALLTIMPGMSTTPPIPASLFIGGLPQDARSAFDLASSAHYASVALPSRHDELAPEVLSATGRRHVKKILEMRHLSADALRLATPRTGLTDAANVDEVMTHARAAIELAHDLGIQTLSLNAGPADDKGKLNSVAESALRELAEQADRSGLRLAISADQPAAISQMLAALGSNQVQANLEPARILAAGVDPLKAAEMLAGKLAQFTAADAVRMGASLQFAELGRGQIPLAQLLRILHEQNFRGPFVVDVRQLGDPASAAHHASETLRRLFADAAEHS